MDPALLPSLAWFAHIAQHRSFTRAAAEMGVTRAALSQNLKALEQRLNVQLLHRTTRDMSLTEEGQQLFDALLPSLVNIEGAVRRLGEARSEPSGLLRVNTSHTAARVLIEPYLSEFFARYPKLRLELVMDENLANIIADGCDAGIRLGESLAEHMVAIPITPKLEMAVVASPAYIAANGEPATPADLIRHNCIRYRFVTGSVFHWEFHEPGPNGHAFTVEPQGSLMTNDDDGMIRAALQGVGLIQHLDIAVRPYLEAGTLVRVLQSWCKPFAGFYLYMPSREHMPAKMRALVDFVVEKREPMVRKAKTKAAPRLA